MAGSRSTSWVAVAAVAAGILWAVHGGFEMLEPSGPVKEYRDDLGYSRITDVRGFLLYGLPGPPAVLLSAAVILATVRRAPARGRARRRTVARWLAIVSGVLGVVALVGVAMLFDPPFEAGTNLGRLLVSVAALVAGGVLRRDGEASRAGAWLQVAGVIGLLVLAARVTVNALELVPAATAFGVSLAFALAWVVAGFHLRPANQDLP